LISKHKYYFYRKFPITGNKQFFQDWAKKINHHNMVLLIDTIPLEVYGISFTLKKISGLKISSHRV
jgi:hypothetical protein